MKLLFYLLLLSLSVITIGWISFRLIAGPVGDILGLILYVMVLIYFGGKISKLAKPKK